MAYFSFNKVTPPTPNEPTVNEITQLNNNWDHIDTKLLSYTQFNAAAPAGIETGQEYITSDGRPGVYNGAALRKPDNVDAAWSAWTAMPMLAPYVIRPGFTFRWRVNTLLRQVELAGGVINTGAASAWPFALATINADSAGSPTVANMPFGGKHIAPCAVALSSSPVQVSGGYVIIDKPGGNTFVRIRAQYLGGPGGGNFMMFDQVRWWY